MIFGENDRIVNPMEAKEVALNAPTVRYLGIPEAATPRTRRRPGTSTGL